MKGISRLHCAFTFPGTMVEGVRFENLVISPYKARNVLDKRATKKFCIASFFETRPRNLYITSGTGARGMIDR